MPVCACVCLCVCVCVCVCQAYLIHPVILRVWYYQKVQLFAFNPIEQAMCFLAATSASYACAVFTYCLIEAPCDGLVKKLMGAK